MTTDLQTLLISSAITVVGTILAMWKVAFPVWIKERLAREKEINDQRLDQAKYELAQKQSALDNSNMIREVLLGFLQLQVTDSEKIDQLTAVIVTQSEDNQALTVTNAILRTVIDGAPDEIAALRAFIRSLNVAEPTDIQIPRTTIQMPV